MGDVGLPFSKIWPWALAALGLLLLLGLGAQTAMRLNGYSLNRVAPQELSAKLRPYYQITKPTGEGPFPTALLASGCDGPRDNLQTWAAALKEAGWASIIVDSHRPRGFENDPTWRLICSGVLLPGGARAGDLAVALADARELDFVDENQMALVGASHGGWAVLDLLALSDSRKTPENLTSWPEAPLDDPISGVIAVAVLYPYCGQASLARRRGWERGIPVAMFLVEGDSIADEQDCIAIANRMRLDDLLVEVRIFEDVTHGFDQKGKSYFSTLRYDNLSAGILVRELKKYLIKTQRE